MLKNTEGLKCSARRRSEAATERAQSAIQRMQADEVEINFRSVAAQAGVSTAWLYKTKALRAAIMKARHTSPAAAGENPQHRQRLSQERIVATLRLRIKILEESNRTLTEQLESAYGRLAIPTTKPDSARRLHVNDVRVPMNSKKKLANYR